MVQVGSTCFIPPFIHATNVFWILVCARSCNQKCDYNCGKHYPRDVHGVTRAYNQDI